VRHVEDTLLLKPPSTAPAHNIGEGRQALSAAEEESGEMQYQGTQQFRQLFFLELLLLQFL
jgi:hypothetical protein